MTPLPPQYVRTCSKTEDEIRAEAAARTKRDIDAILAITFNPPDPNELFRMTAHFYARHFSEIEQQHTTVTCEGEVVQQGLAVRHLSSVPPLGGD